MGSNWFSSGFQGFVDVASKLPTQIVKYVEERKHKPANFSGIATIHDLPKSFFFLLRNDPRN